MGIGLGMGVGLEIDMGGGRPGTCHVHGFVLGHGFRDEYWTGYGFKTPFEHSTADGMGLGGQRTGQGYRTGHRYGTEDGPWDGHGPGEEHGIGDEHRNKAGA